MTLFTCFSRTVFKCLVLVSATLLPYSLVSCLTHGCGNCDRVPYQFGCRDPDGLSDGLDLKERNE